LKWKRQGEGPLTVRQSQHGESWPQGSASEVTTVAADVAVLMVIIE